MGKNIFSSLHIQTRLILLVVILLVPMIFQTILGVWGMNNSIKTSHTIYEDRLIPTEQLADINDLMRANMLQVHLATKHDPRLEESQLHKSHQVTFHTGIIRDNIKKINEIWKKYQNTHITPEEKVLADRYFQLRTEFVSKGLLVAIDLIEKQDFEGANTHSALELPVLFDSAKETLDELLKLQQTIGTELMKEADSQFSFIIKTIIGSTVFFLSLVGLVGYLIVTSITGPLDLMIGRVKDIAQGEGDLTQRIDFKSNDELGTLTEWMNQFINQIHEIITSIQKTYGELIASAEVLNDSSQVMSSGVEEMSIQSETVASSSLQMNKNLLVVSSSMEEMSISISEVAKKASEAAVVVSDAIEAARTSNQTIQELGEVAHGIGKVIESIQSIAQQTNLLALNAAIEAASAGEAGKGFAVVASEVKGLAQEAGKSSEDIKDRILGIQKSVDKTVDSITKITSIINKVNEYSISIASAVEEQSITSKEISSNVDQSNIASNEVAKNITGVSTALKDNSESASKSSDEAKKLKNVADRLGSLVNRFKV